MAKTVKSRKNHNLTQYQEVVNDNGEITISCKNKSKDLRQDLIVNPPCLLMFDPDNDNFVQILVDVDKNLEFVKFIDGVS